MDVICLPYTVTSGIVGALSYVRSVNSLATRSVGLLYEAVPSGEGVYVSRSNGSRQKAAVRVKTRRVSLLQIYGCVRTPSIIRLSSVLCLADSIPSRSKDILEA